MNEFNKGILMLFIFLLSLEIFAESKRKALWVLVCSLLFAAGSIGAAVVKMERFEVSLAVSVIMTGICLGYLWFEKATRRREKAARRQAARLNLQVSEAEREMPAKDGGMEKVSLARYSLPRREGAIPKTWMVTRREVAKGAEIGHGWRLTAGSGEPSDAMKAILRGIVAQAGDEQIEFEADQSWVSAYWKEWGGAEKVEDIHQWLLALSKC